MSNVNLSGVNGNPPNHLLIDLALTKGPIPVDHSLASLLMDSPLDPITLPLAHPPGSQPL